MITILTSIISFIVALGILVTVHEFGHYWVARKAGVKVLRFSIGFGKPLWKRTLGKDQTEFVVAVIPLGGYVKMLDEREGDVAPSELSRAFNRQSLAKRTAIVVAGPLFNFLFAIFAYWVMFVVGIPGIKPIVEEVKPGSIAQLAGIQAGDEFVSIAGRKTPTWNSTIPSLLAKSLDNEVFTIELKDIDNRTRIVTMDLHVRDLKLSDGRILQEIGISPLRPRIAALIGTLLPNGEAVKAGFKPGDLVVAADNIVIEDWVHWVNYIRDRPEQSIKVEVERNGQQVFLELKPARIEIDGEVIGRIGAGVEIDKAVSNELLAILKYSPVQAIWQAGIKTWDMSILTLRMLWKMLVGEVSVKNISGPITIAKVAGDTANAGFITFLAFLAIVSISLGVLNILPIPMLDGGHLLFYLVEVIKGKPVSDAVQANMQQVGLVLILLLMSLALYNDIARLFGS